MKDVKLEIEKYPLVKELIKGKLVHSKCAADLLDNTEGLIRAGMPVSESDLRYIKLALIEQEEYNNK